MARNQHTPASLEPIWSDPEHQQTDQRAGATPSSNGAAPAQPGVQPTLADAQLGAILRAVEQQLTHYFAAMAARADAVQHADEAGRLQLGNHLQHQIDAVTADLDRSRSATEGYEQALEAAIEERLTEFAASQLWRVGEIEGRLDRVTEEISSGSTIDLERVTAPLQQRFDDTTEVFTKRIEELQNAARRFDEQAAAIINHVNDNTSELTRRMDDVGRTFVAHLDERTEQVAGQVAAQLAALQRRIEDTENKTIDRARAMEERINEQTGVRLAGIEATVGRISSGVDDAIVTISRRLIELETSNNAVRAQVEQIATQIDSVDQDAINTLREQMSSAIGESMLVRIELERVASSTGEQFDKFNVRLAELAADIAESTLDVGTAVQLERLEEIERALVELDPDQFVRRAELAATAGGVNTAPTGPPNTDLAPPSANGDSSDSNLSSW